MDKIYNNMDFENQKLIIIELYKNDFGIHVLNFDLYKNNVPFIIKSTSIVYMELNCYDDEGAENLQFHIQGNYHLDSNKIDFSIAKLVTEEIRTFSGKVFVDDVENGVSRSCDIIIDVI